MALIVDQKNQTVWKDTEYNGIVSSFETETFSILLVTLSTHLKTVPECVRILIYWKKKRFYYSKKLDHLNS